jgi:hypothetical protein
MMRASSIAPGAGDLAEEGSDVKGRGLASACGSSGATRTRPCPGVAARPSTAVPATGDTEPERHDGALRPGFLTGRHDVGAGPAT